jgi:hypothetical protein
MPPLPSLPPTKPPRAKNRQRKWLLSALAMSALMGSTQLGCIRFRNEAPGDAGLDANVGADGSGTEEDAGSLAEGGDAVVIPPPVCDRFNSTVAASIAGDLISELLMDCRLRRYFTSLPPVAIAHLQECLTAQVGQVMGCRHPDGQPFKYPTLASNGQFCRDMKSSHLQLTTSDGDFDAFIADLTKALSHNDLTMEETVRVATVFGATRNDIVRIKDAGPTMPCDAPDAN